jgi:hypothetical protein
MKPLFGLLIILLVGFQLKADDIDFYSENNYYDMAIERGILPENFLLTQDSAKKIFKILVCEYYDSSFLEAISVNLYNGFYIIRGRQSDRIIGDRVRVNNSEIILIIKRSDGSIASFFMAQ